MKTTIAGTTMPVLEITLDAGEQIIAEGGDVSWLTPGFDIQTSTGFGSAGKGGFMSSLKRMVGGGQLFLTQYTASASGGFVAFAAQLPAPSASCRSTRATSSWCRRVRTSPALRTSR